jgi:uncharacterized damage-inducible protein DinB
MEENELKDQLLETWRIHCRINLYLIRAIAPKAFNSPPPTKGRSFIQMLAHIHNTRLMWLQSAAPELLKGLTKIEKDETVTPALLGESLTASGQAIEALLEKALVSGGKIKGFKPHASAFVGYLISHESYHHGETGIELARIGYPLDKKTAFGLWEWGVR